MPDAGSHAPEGRRKRGLQRGDIGQDFLAARRNQHRVETQGRNKAAEGPGVCSFFDEHRLVNKLTLDATCPISKETDFKKCAGKMVKA